MTSVELAKRAVACKGWRWMPGMRATHRHCSPIRVLVRDDGEDYECHIVAPGPNGNEIQCIDECGIMGSFPGADGSAYPVLPDLDDPATLGCLLALVREAWADPGMHSSPGTLLRAGDLNTWTVWSGDRMKGRLGETESEALVAALEAAS